MTDVILVADDEADIVSTAKMILEGEGYRVVAASSSDEAIQKADSEKPDLILLDVVMPGKSGLEACKILKSQANTRHIPLVMFTALGRDVNRKLTAESGADGHFTKPFTPDALITEVRRHLDHARVEKFSKQLGIDHLKLQGKKTLFEFDPSTPYERLIRDFALERISQGDMVVVLTKMGAAVRQALEGEKNVELVETSPDLMLSQILEKYSGKSLGVVYDSLTDLTLSAGFQSAYGFTQNSLKLLSNPRITAIFLLNAPAHDPRDVSSLRGLFTSQVVYGRQGIASARIV